MSSRLGNHRKLLLPRYKTLLQKYINRCEADPKLLIYHRESTMLTLRQDLGCPSTTGEFPCTCCHVRLFDCGMVDGLNEAMEERIIEKEIQTQ